MENGVSRSCEVTELMVDFCSLATCPSRFCEYGNHVPQLRPRFFLFSPLSIQLYETVQAPSHVAETLMHDAKGKNEHRRIPRSLIGTP